MLDEDAGFSLAPLAAERHDVEQPDLMLEIIADLAKECYAFKSMGGLGTQLQRQSDMPIPMRAMGFGQNKTNFMPRITLTRLG